MQVSLNGLLLCQHINKYTTSCILTVQYNNTEVLNLALLWINCFCNMLKWRSGSYCRNNSFSGHFDPLICSDCVKSLVFCVGESSEVFRSAFQASAVFVTVIFSRVVLSLWDGTLACVSLSARGCAFLGSSQSQCCCSVSDSDL